MSNQQQSDTTLRENIRVLAAILLRSPKLLSDVSVAFSSLPVPPSYRNMTDAIERWLRLEPLKSSNDLLTQLAVEGFQLILDHVLSDVPGTLPECASSTATTRQAEEGWWQIFALCNEEILLGELSLAESKALREQTLDNICCEIALREAWHKIPRNKAHPN